MSNSSRNHLLKRLHIKTLFVHNTSQKSKKMRKKESFFPTDPNQPSTSGGFQLNSNRDEDLCCVCAAIWNEANEDRLQCLSCNQWACKGRFGVDTLANCVQMTSCTFANCVQMTSCKFLTFVYIYSLLML